MMDTLLPLAFVLIGFGGGMTWMWAVGRKWTLAASSEATAVVSAAKKEAEDIRAAATRQAAEQQERLGAETALAHEQEQEELREYALEIEAREGLLQAREGEFAQWEQEVNAQGETLDTTKDHVRELKRHYQEAQDKTLSTRVARTGSSRDQELEHLVKDRVARAELDLQMKVRENEEAFVEVAQIESRRILSLVVDRYNGIGHLERTGTAVPIADACTLAAFGDPEGASRKAFCEEVECDLMLDEVSNTFSVRGDDPLAREIGRRVLRQIANRAITSPDRIRGIVRQVKGEVDREVMNTGRKTLRQLQVGRAHPDILNLVGRLKYRLSYSQNQLKHSLEVAYLAGMFAEELKLDVHAARRGGILHDIGKAMTHEHEGSHALLGAEEAKRCGEDETTVNVIASHHDDVPCESPIAELVTAADALSGARPGARREAVTQYLDRIRDIQRIAGASRAVRRVDIMQAGREVRVVVAGEELGEIDASDQSPREIVLPDDALAPLASDIARAIEQEVTFPGQIRVTVIRESRAVSMAH